MVTQGELSCYVNNFSLVLLSEKYGVKIGEFVLRYYGLKG